MLANKSLATVLTHVIFVIFLVNCFMPLEVLFSCKLLSTSGAFERFVLNSVHNNVMLFKIYFFGENFFTDIAL